VTLTDTGAHRRGFKGVNTHTHEGPSEISTPPRRGCPFHQGTTASCSPSEISTPPRRGCPFHQGTTASCSSSSRQPRDTALTLPPQNSAHTQTAGQGRCLRRRPTKRPQRRLRASARGLTRKTRADGATKSPFHQQHQHHPQHQGDNRLGGGEPLTQLHSLYWAPQQTHQGDNRLGGGEPLTQLHSTLLGTPTDASQKVGRRRNSTPEGQACGSGRTETRSLHCDLLLDPLVAFSGLCLALV
jgi:hypothetical protein